MIRVYPSRLEGEPLETHTLGGPVNLSDWLSEVAGVEVSQREVQPINVDLNGVELASFDVEVLPGDDVRIYPNLNAEVAVATIVMWAAVGVAVALSVYMYLSMPKAGSATSQAQGNDLDMATVKANQAKPNQVIRESFGHQRIFPDYIQPPFKRFFNLREQYNYFCMSVGVGAYSLLPDRVYIGDTPVSVFGDDVTYQLYPPGASLAGDPNAQRWHVVKEVGGTTTGAGLDLASTSNTVSTGSIAAVLASGLNLNTVDASDEWPETWNAGLVLTVALPQQITVTVGTGGASRLSGNFTDLAPFVGMRISLDGDEVGDYTVAVYSPPVAPVPGVGGSPSSIAASASPTTYDFSGSSAVFSITFQGSTYPVQLTANYVNMSGLLASLTDQLVGSGLVAQDISGRVRIVEPLSPYLGGVITASGLPVSVFGASPTFTVGTASTGGTPGQDAYIEMTFDDGTLAVGIAPGLRRFAVGYRGFQYRISSRTATQLVMQRLTDTGAVDAGWAGWVARYLTDQFISTGGEGATGFNWIGPFMACPENELTSTLEYDIFLPQGIGATDRKKGRPFPIQLSARVEWRDAALGGAWNVVDWVHSAYNVDQIGFTEVISLPYPMRPQVRMRRITPVVNDGRTRDALNWFGLRSRLDGPTSYSDVTVMTMKVRGGDRLSQQSENQVSLEAIRILSGAPSRSIRDAIYYVLADLGVPASAIDTDTIDAVAAGFWGVRGDTYDHQVMGQQVARDTLQGMMAAGMSHLTLRDGRVSTRREGVQAMPAQTFTPLQMTRQLESKFSGVSPDDYDGVDVEFMNEITWAVDTVKCRLDVANPVKVEKIQLDGVTNRTRAWRIGMRQLRKHRLQRWEYSTETEMDALGCEYLDRVALVDDAVGYSQSAMIVAVSGDVVEVSEPIDWAGVDAPRARVRRHDGTATALFTPVRIDDYTMRLPGLADDFTPDTSFEIEPCALHFGAANRLEYAAMVIEVSPDSEGNCKLSAVEYRDDLYADDDNDAPALS